MGMTTSLNASRHIIQIIHPLDVKRNCNTILNNTNVSFPDAMMPVQFYHLTILDGILHRLVYFKNSS